MSIATSTEALLYDGYENTFGNSELGIRRLFAPPFSEQVSSKVFLQIADHVAYLSRFSEKMGCFEQFIHIRIPTTMTTRTTLAFRKLSGQTVLINLIRYDSRL